MQFAAVAVMDAQVCSALFENVQKEGGRMKGDNISVGSNSSRQQSCA
jgi:hypothetical protein